MRYRQEPDELKKKFGEITAMWFVGRAARSGGCRATN